MKGMSWKKTWILHQDSATSHNTLALKQILAGKSILVLMPLFSGFRALCLSPVPNVKSALKGAHFQSVYEMKPKTADLLNRVAVSSTALI
jgi:hypothetical protein